MKFADPPAEEKPGAINKETFAIVQFVVRQKWCTIYFTAFALTAAATVYFFSGSLGWAFATLTAILFYIAVMIMPTTKKKALD